MKKLGLYVFFFSYFYWYFFGFFHSKVSQIDLSLTTLILVISSPLIFFCGYSSKSFYSHKQYSYLKIENIFAIFLIIILIFSSIYSLNFFIGMVKYHLIRIITALSIFLLSIALLLKNQIFRIFLFIILFYLFFSFFFDLYSRRSVLGFIFPILYFFILSNITQNNKNISYLKIFVSLCFAIFAIYFFQSYRVMAHSYNYSDIILDVFIRFSKSSGNDTIHLTEYVIKNYNQNNFLNGSTFISGIFNLIPRELWSEKPEAFSIILSSNYYNLPSEDIPTNFGPGLIAEAYANFGILAVIITFYFFGLLIKLYDNWNIMDPFELKRFASSTIIYSGIFFLIRGDFVNGFYEIYFKYLILFMLFFIYRIKLHKN